MITWLTPFKSFSSFNNAFHSPFSQHSSQLRRLQTRWNEMDETLNRITDPEMQLLTSVGFLHDFLHLCSDFPDK
ncbi:hypothetical protein PRIPAC_74946 [Pristionchus pacificus]|uniref:Uncharacterized protein n=1 Tax=Pristionchus pacificus TaxID=54126 RepID=A0A2A6C013_PRIPA|nr:hypothetical protein PRIPAC_74946 [Pristionchus pacificus]|eukprot:PDM71480.1 hypothetical protein PRIPAC_37887 [Pristionchus pacificus]